MSFLLYLYGAIVLACGLLVAILTARPDLAREKRVIEALERGDHGRAVRLMLDL